MYNILSYAMSHAFNYKTNKSIYNILTGKKSHQTFFDASSQQLLSLYHSLPNLKYSTFEQFILQKDDFKNQFKKYIHNTLMIVSLKPLVAYNYLSKRYLIHARSQIHLFQSFKIPISNKGLNNFIIRSLNQIKYQIL